MKAATQSIILAVLIFSAGIANSDNALVDDYGNQPMSVVYATCTISFRDGRQFSEVSSVDRSDDLLPAPREGSTCAEYTARLLGSGARVDTSGIACDVEVNTLFPEPDRLCLFVIIALYG